MTASKTEFFNPAKMSSRDKAELTDHTARAIIAAELSEREKKTEKLRALRLEKAADEPAAPVKKTAGRKKAAAK